MAISSKTEKKLNKRIYIGAGILAGLIVILIILVVADSLAGGKLYIKNDTDKKIEEMHVFFDCECSLAGGVERLVVVVCVEEFVRSKI